MVHELTVERVFGCENPLVDVLFVHGLAGDPRETWTTGSEAEFWPMWLKEDLQNISVYTLGYPASTFEKLAKKEMDMFERAGNVLEQVAGLGIGERPIVFVSHSLGGILVKIILRKSCEARDEGWSMVSGATKLVFFLATPHKGAGLAMVPAVLPRNSKHIVLLANRSGFLEDLNDRYRKLTEDQDDLSTIAYYEKHATYGSVIVPRESADPGCSRVELIGVDKNHVGICKPSNKDDTVYLGIKRRVQKVVRFAEEASSGGVNPTWVEDYKERSEMDRRDLHQKLIDAGREYEYSYANGAQNRFARHYTKTGLLKAALEDHENLLAEVETRFVNHVYHPLICKSATDEEIRAALQKMVIDPLVDRKIGGTRFSARIVMNALYFLTEQCHVRWDVPK